MSAIAEQLEPITAPVAKFLRRFHLVLYSVFIIGGLAGAIFMISGLLATSEVDTPLLNTGFDKQTIELIKNFEPANSSIDSFSLPSGRVNPFAE